MLQIWALVFSGGLFLACLFLYQRGRNRN